MMLYPPEGDPKKAVNATIVRKHTEPGPDWVTWEIKIIQRGFSTWFEANNRLLKHDPINNPLDSDTPEIVAEKRAKRAFAKLHRKQMAQQAKIKYVLYLNITQKVESHFSEMSVVRKLQRQSLNKSEQSLNLRTLVIYIYIPIFIFELALAGNWL